MKRYCVVLLQPSIHCVVVEFYWADDYSHAEEQALNANPPDCKMIACVRDPVQPQREEHEANIQTDG